MNEDEEKASVARFERVFASMFTQAVELPDWPPWQEASTGLDGVIARENGCRARARR